MATARKPCAGCSTGQQNAVTRPRPFAERRRADPATFCDLRRALQEADAKLFEQKLAMETLTAGAAGAKRGTGWRSPRASPQPPPASAAGNAMHGRLATDTSEQATQSSGSAGNRSRVGGPAARYRSRGPAQAGVHVPGQPEGERHIARVPAKATLKSGSRLASDDKGCSNAFVWSGCAKRLR